MSDGDDAPFESGRAYHDGKPPSDYQPDPPPEPEEKEEGWGPFRPFSEWGKSDPEPEPKGSDFDDGESPSHRKSTDAGM